MATSWDSVLNNPPPSVLSGGAGATGSPADDGVLVAASKFASKCRGCQATIDIGDSAWFQKSGEPGRKTTCVACHGQKVAAAGDSAAPDPSQSVQKPKKTIKKKRPETKLSADMLCDLRTGVASIFREFRTLKFKGKKHEAADLHKLLSKYAEWAHAILPAVDFSDFVQKLDKVGGNSAVRSRISFLRDVQQGLASLDDLQEIEDNYNAHRVDEFGLPLDDDAPDLGPGALDDDDDWHVGGGAAQPAGAAATAAVEAAAQAAGPVTVTAEQAERMARNRQLALERAAARGGAAAPAAGGASTGGAASASGGSAAAGAMPSEDEFPEEESYPDEDDEINDDDEAMAADFDDEFDAPAEDPARHARHAAERAAAAQAETAAYGGAETGAEELDGITRAAEVETEAYGAMETQAAQAEAEPVSAADAAAASSMDAALANTAGDAAARRAQALADAMDMEEGDL